MSIDISEQKVNRNEFGLWLGWTLATAVGMVVGYLPAALFIQDVPLWIARVLVPLLAGILISAAQWLVLRNYVVNSRSWMINHTFGWTIGYIIGLLVVSLVSGFPLGGLIGYLLFGIIVALFQFPVLRREIPHLWVWVVANMIAWTLAAYVSQVVAGSVFITTKTTLVTSTLLTVGVTGLVGGAITAIALIWLVRKPDQLA